MFGGGIHPSLGIDLLSAFFLVVLATVATPSLVFMRGYLPGTSHGAAIWVLTVLFIGALALVITARDIVTFLAGWELMTLIPASLILVNRSDRPARTTAWVYLAATHLGGVGVWVALLQLSFLGPPSTFAGRAILMAAALVGFGTKAGLMPFHSWLPRAHPAVPSPVSALMSGVMIKVAIYGLVRVILAAGIDPTWWGTALLVLGALSAVGGVVYALFQHELKRLLAFHSIENIGIIALGLGAWSLLAGAGQVFWAELAFVAAMLHVLNHAIFKALLFLGAGAIEQSAHIHDVDHAGGILKRMPWTGGTFLIGSMAIAGLPPLNGFVSEWLTFQALIHTAALRGVEGTLAAGAAGLLAATAALAVMCFVKVCGLTLLGSPRSEGARVTREVVPTMRAALVFLASLCVVLGAGLPIWFSSMPTTGGLPTLSILAVVGAVVAVLLWLRGRSAAPAPAWTCGQAIEPSLNWTSSGFSKPLRLAWEWLLRPERELAINRSHGMVRSVSYRGAVHHLFDTAFFVPVVTRALDLTAVARRLQSGSLRAYAIYLGALLVVALALSRIGVI